MHLIVPTLVATIKEHEMYGESQLATSESRTTTFVDKIVQMLAPLFHSTTNSNSSSNNSNNSNSNSNNISVLTPLGPESFDDHADDGLVATALEIDLVESFLFGYEGATATLTTLVRNIRPCC